MKTTRLNTGLYEVTHEGRTFEIEDINQASDGEIPRAWMLYEIIDGNRDWWNDFHSLRYAKAVLADALGA
jgi:endo-1,4-beta-D-glucanase Y